MSQFIAFSPWDGVPRALLYQQFKSSKVSLFYLDLWSSSTFTPQGCAWKVTVVDHTWQSSISQRLRCCRPTAYNAETLAKDVRIWKDSALGRLGGQQVRQLPCILLYSDTDYICVIAYTTSWWLLKKSDVEFVQVPSFLWTQCLGRVPLLFHSLSLTSLFSWTSFTLLISLPLLASLHLERVYFFLW